jgi:hypothetical protein
VCRAASAWPAAAAGRLCFGQGSPAWRRLPARRPWRCLAMQVVSQGTDFASLAAEVRPYFTEAIYEPGAVIIEARSSLSWR